MSPIIANAAAGQGQNVGGLAIVLLALAAFYLLCAGVDYLHKRRERREPPQADRAPAAAEEPSAGPSPGALPEELLVVIAAAAAAAIDQPHRILGVRRVVQNTVWSLEGRRSLYASRQLRR